MQKAIILLLLNYWVMKQNEEFRKPTKEDVLRSLCKECPVGPVRLAVGVSFYGMIIAIEDECYSHFTLDVLNAILAYGMALVSSFYDTEEKIGHITYSGDAIMVRSMHGIYFKLFHFRDGIFECVAVLDV